MKNLTDLGSLTLREFLASAVGPDEAERLLGIIQEALQKGIKDDELKKLIHKALCQSSVADIDLYHVLYSMPQVVTK